MVCRSRILDLFDVQALYALETGEAKVAHDRPRVQGDPDRPCSACVCPRCQDVAGIWEGAAPRRHVLYIAGQLLQFWFTL